MEEENGEARFKVCRRMQLQEFPDKFVFQSTDSNSQPQPSSFSIDRSDGIVTPHAHPHIIGDSSCKTPTKVSTIFGVVGTIRLLAGTYVLVITSCKEVGTYLGFPLFRVMSLKFLACNNALKLSTSQEKRDEAYFMSLLRTVESTPGLYYSYEVDLTLNLQRTCRLADGRTTKPLWKQGLVSKSVNVMLAPPPPVTAFGASSNLFLLLRLDAGDGNHRIFYVNPSWLQQSLELISNFFGTSALFEADPRFVWNRNLLEELIESKLDRFIIPLVQGSFQTAQFVLKDAPARITLISRRCMRRLGTRMWRRGANLEGDVANFIETEQLLEFEGSRSSFLQVRGSIPILWEQIVDLSYKPHLRIIDNEETPKVVERHFHDLTQRYGEIVVVDLTDKHGDEGHLSMAYATEMQKLPHVRYVSFDFHHCCGNANFENLQILYDQISDDIEKQGYFLVNLKGEILWEQKGVVRGNCIDCLDRTNVTQSYLARKSLNSQLQRMDVLSPNECISMYVDIYEKFKILWADQGDEISLEYSGTLALKGDLVRFGRQTLSGLIKDGMSALSRYYLNNFHDGIRQDAMDLISGRYTVNRNSPSPFQLNGFESFSYLPVASALIVGGLTFATFSLNQAGRNAQHFVSSVVWAGLTAGVMATVKANGRQFCSRPRLCGLL